jgi:hypothetical protein
MWCNVGFAEKISLMDIKIGDKISKHFNSQQISKYYISNAEKSPSGERLFGKDLKYSFIAMIDEDGIFSEDYNFFQITYENDSKKIVSISGTDFSSDKDTCLKKKNNKVSEYKSKNRITTLFNKKENTHTFPDGTTIYDVAFHGPIKIFTFACYVYPGDKNKDVEYSLTIYENNYNIFIWEAHNK